MGKQSKSVRLKSSAWIFFAGIGLAAVLTIVVLARTEHGADTAGSANPVVSAASRPLQREKPSLAPEPDQRVAATEVRSPENKARPSENYADNVRRLSQRAAAGDHQAQYELSEAMRYCSQNIARFFHHGNGVQTLGEAQARWARLGSAYNQEWVQSQIATIYERCHEYLDGYSPRDQLGEWRLWLERAAASGLPRAQILYAVIAKDEAAIGELSGDSKDHVDPTTISRAKEKAIEALDIRDAAGIWMMSDLSSDVRRPKEQQDVLPAAWQLLACDRGYDCSASADWVQSECVWDVQCSPGESGVDNILRRLGNNTDHARALATELATAIEAKNWDRIRQLVDGTSIS